MQIRAQLSGETVMIPQPSKLEEHLQNILRDKRKRCISCQMAPKSRCGVAFKYLGERFRYYSEYRFLERSLEKYSQNL